jgi:putative ATPase
MPSQSEIFEKVSHTPLARRMAPRDLDEFVGQEHLVGPGKPLRTLIEKDAVTSLILWGPPGCGKTALAGIIASRTQSDLVRMNAVTSTIEDIRNARKEAKGRRSMGRRTILFLDEVHRFNKTQQDALLPDVEEGTFILFGTTTHNPYFAISAALISRSRVFTFKKQEPEDLLVLLKRALSDKLRGLGSFNIQADEDALRTIANASEGDARTALNSLELAVLASTPDADGPVHLTVEGVTTALQRKHLRYDRNEDEHYDIISAFIKSVRGSDPDAAIYWLARMLAGGEDPRFIARRLIILASEDIGNADPRGFLMATAVMQAVETIGMPEVQINLAQVTAYLACAPKSNASVMAISSAMKDVEEEPLKDVPIHLRDASYKGAQALGHGKDYKYPHSEPGAWVDQSYMPNPKVYYSPTDRGVEAKFKEVLARLKASRRQPGV